MTQTLQESDNLTLDLVKQHLYIDITNDDTLLTSYIATSLETVKKFCRTDVLETTYTSNTFEDIIILNTFNLSLKYKPNEVKILSTNTIPDNILDKTYKYTQSTNLVNEVIVGKDFYTFLNGELIIDIQNILEYDSTTVLSTQVKTGTNPVNKNIDQARLLLIGGWYSNRESSTNLNVKEIPYNVGLLLDLESNSVI